MRLRGVFVQSVHVQYDFGCSYESVVAGTSSIVAEAMISSVKAAASNGNAAMQPGEYMYGQTISAWARSGLRTVPQRVETLLVQ